jgi:hypothetical protein
MTPDDPYGFNANPNASAQPSARGASSPRAPDFSTGITGETDVDNTASVFSLNRDAARFNAQVPHQMRPTFLTPIQRNPGGNGMSADQAARRFADGTPMGNPNGISASSFQKAALLRMAGQDSGIE